MKIRKQKLSYKEEKAKFFGKPLLKKINGKVIEFDDSFEFLEYLVFQEHITEEDIEDYYETIILKMRLRRVHPYFKTNEHTEYYLNWLYEKYVLEKDEKLTKGAIELKKHLKYVIDYLIQQDVLEKIKTENNYVEIGDIK